MKLDVQQRRAGLFVPVFALRTETDLGIGDTGGLRQLVNWCQDLNVSILQILPINETSDDNSPYNVISSQALEPATLEITPELIPGLTSTDMKKLATATTLKKLRKGPVQYKAVKKLKRKLLETAFEKFISPKAKAKELDSARKEFADFIALEKSWLDDYALFRALMEQNGHPDWERWSKEHRAIESARKWLNDLSEAKKASFEKDMQFFMFAQWLLFKQWKQVRAEAEAKGVYLMGDISFGVSRCSVDVWAHPQQFKLEWSAGAPPEGWFKGDPFTEQWGQNWGVPVYNWDAMKKDGYLWWRKRIQGTTRFFHTFRLDHILGFYRVYAFPWQPRDNHLYIGLDEKKAKAKAGDLPKFIPYDDKVKEQAELNQKHGEELLQMVLQAAGDATVIGEDLGMVPDYVRPSLTKIGISGFKIPIFEKEWNGEYKKPEEYPALSVTTLSTHDHETMLGFWESWWKKFEEGEKLKAKGKGDKSSLEEAEKASWEVYRTQRFAWLDDRAMLREYEPQVREGVCRRSLKSASWLTILMITDLLGLSTRFNVPGPSADSNWSERLPYTVTELATSPDLENIRGFIRWAIQESDRKR
ncbi:MAG: 4-alpha-glucanotransferase [Verrucomicrobiota bacterium]